MPLPSRIVFTLLTFLSIAAITMSEEPRIIDGTLVSASQFPTVGKIEPKDKSEFCSGTLIAPRFVLCAAHCVNNQMPGSLMTPQDGMLFELGGKTYQSKHIYVHPTYAGNSSQQQEGAIDLSIIELNTEIPRVIPSPLYRKVPEVGTILTLAGYGLLGTGASGVGSKEPPRGMISTGKTPIDAVTSTFVEWNFDNVPPPNQESNTAPGDSGGPQFITENGVQFVASVTSGGVKNNASFGDFSYNTRVDIAIPWIESITGGTIVAGNHDPVITSFISSATGIMPGTKVTFSVTASDPDNDMLHYHWLFGDGSEILDGQPTQSHTYSSDGSFPVVLAVTDAKGGSAGASVTIQTVSSTPPSTPMTPATLAKKTFTVDLSSRNSGAAVDIAIQSPALQFADKQAFQAAFPGFIATTLYLGNDSVGGGANIPSRSTTFSSKMNTRTGIIECTVKDSEIAAVILNYYGVKNVTGTSSVTLPVSIEIDAFNVAQSVKKRFGADATFSVTSKMKSAAKGK